MRLKDSQSSERTRHGVDQEFLTPGEVSKKLKVTSEQVRNLIRQGRLAAVNVGSGRKRPLYRIRQKALEDFLDASEQKEPSTKKRKFVHRTPTQDFFPHLR